MREELFAELLESVREGGAILRGRLKPSREFRFDEPDVRTLREGYGLSQTQFAALLGISPGTLRNWEQGRRKPEGSARVLLRVVARHPEAVLEVVSGAPNPRMQRTRKRWPNGNQVQERPSSRPRRPRRAGAVADR
jgi:putative transcriptional regulator